jgi:hypothetical protein
MLRRLLVCVSLLLASAFQPSFADPSDLQLVSTTVENNQVAFQVGNPSTSAESARLQVSVRVADGSTEVLTTSTVTVPGSTTSIVTVSASTTIVQIIDDPEPISP